MLNQPPFAFFLPRLSAGGAERVLLAVAGELVRRGHRCDLVTAQPGGRWQDRVPAGVRHLSLGRAKPLHAVPALASYLRRERPRALLSSVFAANFAALLACRLAGTGTRCVIREAYWAADEVVASSSVTTLVNRAALRWLYPRADAVIVLSDRMAGHIAKAARVPMRTIHVISNPAPTTTTALDSTIARGTDAPPLVLGCGRLESQKDFATLLRAFAKVRQLHPARLVILGEGSQRQPLASLANDLGVSDDVELHGYAADPVAWMRRSRVFVSTSRSEGFPNVHLEALAAGCQVVSTDSSDAVAVVLDGGRLGAIVPVADVDAVAQQILAALDSAQSVDPTEHLRRFRLEAIANRYLAVLDPTHAVSSEVSGS